jgi:hypothetical protein
VGGGVAVNGITHPFTGALYEPDGDGAIKVTLDGTTGRFTSDGRWLSGELREADPHLCGWVSGSRLESGRLTQAVDGNGVSGGGDREPQTREGGRSWS